MTRTLAVVPSHLARAPVGRDLVRRGFEQVRPPTLTMMRFAKQTRNPCRARSTAPDLAQDLEVTRTALALVTRQPADGSSSRSTFGLVASAGAISRGAGGHRQLAGQAAVVAEHREDRIACASSTPAG